ncbi:TIGR03086 family metal-binding protein [Saccharopolyspora tripterygii]
MSAREPLMGPELIGLLERGFDATASVLEAVPEHQWGAPSPCEAWSTGQIAGHLVGGLVYFGQAADGQAPELPTDEPRPTGAGVAGEFDDAARFDLAVFSRTGVLDQQHDFAFGPTPGWVIANIALSESLLHGWDLARAVGAPYAPGDDLADAVMRFQAQAGEEQLRSEGMFGPAEPEPPNATPFEALLAFTGRQP